LVPLVSVTEKLAMVAVSLWDLPLSVRVGRVGRVGAVENENVAHAGDAPHA
jgi:hypothetical protein